MTGSEDSRLFEADDLLSERELAAEAAEALAPAEGQRHPDLDAARLWRSRDDGQLVRGVNPHSAEKSSMVSRSIDTVSSAMSGKWFASKHGLEYVELYSGPGRLLNEHTKALVVAYLDPARPQDLHWSTVDYLADNFEFIDLIINLPVNSVMRSILGAHRGGGTGPGTAGRFLNHPRPHELLRWSRAGKLINGSTIAAIRDHYDEQLMGLEFRKAARRTVDFPAENPYYDVLYVSRHATGVDFWHRTNPAPPAPATLF